MLCITEVSCLPRGKKLDEEFPSLSPMTVTSQCCMPAHTAAELGVLAVVSSTMCSCYPMLLVTFLFIIFVIFVSVVY